MQEISDRDARIANAVASVKSFVDRAKRVAETSFDEEAATNPVVVAQLAGAMAITFAHDMTAKSINDFAATIRESKSK